VALISPVLIPRLARPRANFACWNHRRGVTTDPTWRKGSSFSFALIQYDPSRSLLDGADDDSLWRRDLLDLLRTGLANRFLVNLTGDRGWRWILSLRLAGQDVGQAIRKLYRPTTLTRTLYPVTYLSHKLSRSKSRAAARVPPPAKIVAGEPSNRLEP